VLARRDRRLESWGHTIELRGIQRIRIGRALHAPSRRESLVRELIKLAARLYPLPAATLQHAYGGER
jgi:hypothetical protein